MILSRQNLGTRVFQLQINPGEMLIRHCAVCVYDKIGLDIFDLISVGSGVAKFLIIMCNHRLLFVKSKQFGHNKCS